MGDGEPAPPTESVEAPTDFAGLGDQTEIAHAWALDYDDAVPTERILTPRRITLLGVAASVALVVAAGTVVYFATRESGTVAASASSSVVTVAAPPQSTVTIAPAAVPPPAPRPPAPVSIPMDRYGQVHVQTFSGKTVCAMTAGDVECNVRFTNQLGPVYNGMPVSGVGVSSRGAWQWLYGDPGDPDYVTMNYGTTYRALGWTITPTKEGTTFMYDATGHGMTISVDGFSPF
jgi:hypothetical protein